MPDGIVGTAPSCMSQRQLSCQLCQLDRHLTRAPARFSVQGRFGDSYLEDFQVAVAGRHLVSHRQLGQSSPIFQSGFANKCANRQLASDLTTD